jgi:hypothetical protein
MSKLLSPHLSQMTAYNDSDFTHSSYTTKTVDPVSLNDTIPSQFCLTYRALRKCVQNSATPTSKGSIINITECLFKEGMLHTRETHKNAHKTVT